MVLDDLGQAGVHFQRAVATPEVGVSDGRVTAVGPDRGANPIEVGFVQAGEKFRAQSDGCGRGRFVEIAPNDARRRSVVAPALFQTLLPVVRQAAPADDGVFERVLVHDLEADDLVVLGVGEAGIGVFVGEQVADELLVKERGAFVDHREKLAQVEALLPRPAVHLGERRHPDLAIGRVGLEDVDIAGQVTAGEVGGKGEIDALLSQGGVEIVEAVKRVGIEFARSVLVGDERAAGHVRIPVLARAQEVMRTHQIDAEAGQVGGKRVGASVVGIGGDQIDAPEADDAAVGGVIIRAGDGERGDGIGGRGDGRRDNREQGEKGG